MKTSFDIPNTSKIMLLLLSVTMSWFGGSGHSRMGFSDGCVFCICLICVDLLFLFVDSLVSVPPPPLLLPPGLPPGSPGHLGGSPGLLGASSGPLVTDKDGQLAAPKTFTKSLTRYIDVLIIATPRY